MSYLLSVTLHIVGVRLTCLINITYLLTYLRPHPRICAPDCVTNTEQRLSVLAAL